MNDQLATLRTLEGKPVLRFERRLARPPEKLWRAITEPDEMRHWFPAAVDTELTIGAPMRFSFGDSLDLGSEYADGEILELDPPKVYAFRWVGDVLRFELLPDGAGCLLTFTATLSGRSTTGDLPSAARTTPGWDSCLAGLTARLDGHAAPQPGDSWFLARAERYVEEFGLGEGEPREHGDGYLVRFERDLMQPVEEVWRVLTTDADPAVGSPPPPRATNDYVPASAITELRSPHDLEYAWEHAGAAAGHVRFALAVQRPIGTRLVVTQTVPVRLACLRSIGLAAWQTHLELFFAALYGDIRRPWPAGRTERLERMYAARLG